MRCVDLTDGELIAGMAQERTTAMNSAKTMMPLLQQTFAYAEDQLGEPVSQVILCGFEDETERLGSRILADFKIPFMPLQSKFGSASSENAGLLGMLEKYAA